MGTTSPAERASVKQGDVILKIGDTAIADTKDLVAALSTVEAGVEIPVTIWRGTAQTVVNVHF